MVRPELEQLHRTVGPTVSRIHSPPRHPNTPIESARDLWMGIKLPYLAAGKVAQGAMEVKHRMRGSEREKIESDWVHLLDSFGDPRVLTQAGMGELRDDLKYHDAISETHPKLRQLLLGAEHYLVGEGVLLPVAAVLEGIMAVNGRGLENIPLTDILAVLGLPLINALVNPIIAARSKNETGYNSEIVRKAIEPDPIHLRLATAVAYKKYTRSLSESGDEGDMSFIFAMADEIRAVAASMPKEQVQVEHRPRDPQLSPRRHFMNMERALVLADIVENPKLGIQLLEHYLPNDEIYKKIRFQIPKELTKGDFYLKARGHDSQGVNVGRIREALQEMEIPQMMCLLFETNSALERQSVFINHERQDVELKAQDQKNRLIDIKQATPFLFADHILNDHVVEPYMKHKLVYDLGLLFMDKTPTKYGPYDFSQCQSSEEYYRERNAAAENAQILLNWFADNGNSEVADYVLSAVKKRWERTQGYIAGDVLPDILLHTLESQISILPPYSPSQIDILSFMYESFRNCMEKTFIPTITSEKTSPQAVEARIDSIIQWVARNTTRWKKEAFPYEIGELNKMAVELQNLSTRLIPEVKMLVEKAPQSLSTEYQVAKLLHIKRLCQTYLDLPRLVGADKAYKIFQEITESTMLKIL